MEAHQLVKLQTNENIDDFTPGDTVQVGVRVTEANRTRTQVFEGVVIRSRGSGPGASFTVRRVSYEIGVERTFMLHSPNVEYVKLVRRGRVRRARLYYLRGRSGRAARIPRRPQGARKAPGGKTTPQVASAIGSLPNSTQSRRQRPRRGMP